MSDIQQFGIYVAAISALIILSEILRKTGKIPRSATRKIVHVGVGILSMLPLFYISEPFWMITAGAIFVVVNSIATVIPLFPGLNTSRKTLGISYFPLAFIILILLFWENQKYLILYGLAHLTFADCMASLVGERFRSREYIWLTDKKSVPGSSALVITSLVITVLFFLFQPLDMPQIPSVIPMIALALSIAVTALLSESLSIWGSDNITLSLFPALFFSLMLNSPYSGVNSFLLATVLAALLGFAALKKRWLTAGGVAMMFLQTYLIICFGSLKMILPMLLFFLFSSIMSKIVDRIRKKECIEKKGSERDGWQVFANGSFPALLALLYHFFPETSIMAAFGVSICAAISDTWSTEIGALSKGDPLSVLTLKRVPKGTSGGISLPGTLGGFAGSLLVAIIFTALFPGLLSLKTGTIIFLCGACGTLIDSFMGALIQLKLRCDHCGKITEQEVHCGSETSYHSGIRWINNDVVNWLSIGITVMMSILILK